MTVLVPLPGIRPFVVTRDFINTEWAGGGDVWKCSCGKPPTCEHIAAAWRFYKDNNSPIHAKIFLVDDRETNSEQSE